MGREEDETEWIVGSRGNVNEVNIGGKKTQQTQVRPIEGWDVLGT